MATQPTPYITVGEYLAQEETSGERHEYLDGKVFVVEGATLAHATIAVNLLMEIGSQLKGSNCRVFGADLTLQTSPSSYSYADAVISCAPAKVDRDTLLNPSVIVEVLSPSTEGYDRGKKFQRYRQLASFREYLIVAQDQVYVEHHIRGKQPSGEQVWTMREFNSLESVISLESVNVQLACAAIYADIAFASE